MSGFVFGKFKLFVNILTASWDLKRFPAVHFQLNSPNNFVYYFIVINIILVDFLHHIYHVWVISLCLICTAELFSLVFDESKS